MSDRELCIDHSRLESVYGPLAEAIRRLIDVSIRTEADPAVVAAAKSKIDSAADELSATLQPGSFGVQLTPNGETIAWGNVVIGVRNPVAPPLVIHHEPDGLVWSEFVLGAAYEGPPGHVHGGVCALVLDHVLGATAHRPGRPAYTGTLTLRYRRRTPLGRPLRAQAHVERTEGVKTFAVGHLADEEGVTVEAEGVFIPPKQCSA
ncbi:MAG TPA: PaaI family thioesterase [Mycobacterium sp.]|nr:PaaI family thioesterase [Mycobacterium sp.]HWT49433.1 PaaI family thioesterase [Mycobacterium sp.]